MHNLTLSLLGVQFIPDIGSAPGAMRGWHYKKHYLLTYRGRNKMTAILQMVFSKQFFCMETFMFIYWSIIDVSLSLDELRLLISV